MNESCALAALCGILLPTLSSGEVRVKDAKCCCERAEA